MVVDKLVRDEAVSKEVNGFLRAGFDEGCLMIYGV